MPSEYSTMPIRMETLYTHQIALSCDFGAVFDGFSILDRTIDIVLGCRLFKPCFRD